MDPISDLSLLEISGEDDSLLLSDASTSANLFSCSPLVSLRSRPRQIKGSETDGVDSEDVISSPKDSANKENANCSKPEAPKLSVEPQQMKRKKKLGGYNLRKSLAWDQAFFTEQGVLNPLELSMISGTATPNAKSNLDVIDEEEPASTSSALQEIEENLFKQSSEGVFIRDKKIGAGAGLSPNIGAGSGLSPKPGALIKQTPPRASLAKRKVIAVNDVGNRSKRSACPRPAPSSSTSTVKTPSKETKITRIPGPKSNVSANATSTRSGILSSGSAKRNQNAHLATNVQTSAGVKGQSKILRTVPIIPKVDLANKYSVTRTLTKQDGKHLDNSVSKTCPPSRLHQTGSGANKVSGGCIPQGVPDSGNKKQQMLLQTTKSSGLRMPSPSLGYFSQAKASNSHGQLQKSSIPCKPSASNIPKPRKLETISVKEARSKIVEGVTNNCTKELSISDVKSEPSMQIDNKQMAGVEVECYSLGFENISKQAEVINILKHVNLKSKEQRELHENEKVSSMVFPTHEKEVFTKSRTHEQLEKEADHTLDNKFNDVLSNGDQYLYQQPQSMHCFITQSTSSNISNTVHNAIAQDEDDHIKGPTCDILTFKESVVLQEEHGTSFKDSRHSGEFKEYNSVKTALLNSSLNDFSKTVPVRFIQGTPCKNTESVNGGAGEFGSCGGDGQVHLLNEGLSINCNETSKSNLEAVNQQLQDGQLKVPHPSIVGDTVSEKENESDMNSCQPVHVTTLFSKGAPEKSMLEINGASENEIKTTEIKEIHDRTQEFELDRLSEDYRTVSAAACCTNNVTNVSPERRPFPENNVKNLHLTPEICPTVNDGCDSDGSNMPIKNSSITPQSQIRDDNFSMDTSINCEVQCDVSGNLEQQASMFTYPEINEIPWKNESLVPNHDHLLHRSEFAEVCADVISNTENSDCSGAENSSCLLQHTPLTQSIREFDHTYKEIEDSHEEDAQTQSFNENPEAYDCSSKHCLTVTNDQFALSDCNSINEDSHLPEFQKPSAVVAQDSQNVDNILHLDSDCLPTMIVSCAEIKEQNLVKGAFDGCRFDKNEHDAANHHTYRKIEESHKKDAQGQSFIENPIAYDCSSKHCLADTNIIKEDSHLHEFQKLSAVVALDSQFVNNILQVDSDCLPTNIVSSAEIKEQNLVDGAFEGCRFHTKENDASNSHIQDMPENKDGNDFVDERMELLQIDGAEEGSSDILPLVEVQLNDNVISAEFDSSIEVSEDPFTSIVACESEDQCFLSEKPKLLASDNPTFDATIPHGSEVSSGAFEGCRFHTKENDASNSHFQDMPENKDGNDFVDERMELLQIDGAEEGSSDILPLVEVQLNDNVISAEFDSSIEVSEDPFTSIVACESEDQCFLSEKSKLLASDNPTFDATIPHGSEVSSGAFEGCRFHTKENDVSNSHIQDMPENKDGNDFVDETMELLQIDGAEEGSSDILPLVEVQLNDNVISAEFDSSIEVTEDPFTSIVACKSEDQCFLSEKSKLLASDNPTFDATIPHGSEVSSGAFEGCRFHTKENDASNSHFQDMSENKDGNDFVDERMELLQIDGAEEGSSDILPLVEVQLDDNVISAEFYSSIEVSEDPFTSIVVCESEDQCFLSEKSKLLASDNPTFDATIPHGSEVSSGAFEGCRFQTKENDASNCHIQDMPENKDGNVFVDERMELLQIDGTEEGSSDILPLDEVQLNDNVISAEFDSSIEVSEDPFTSIVACESEDQCFLSEKSKLIASENPTFDATIPHGSEVSSVNSRSFSDVAETNIIVENEKFPYTNMPCQTKDTIDLPEDNSKIIHLEKSPRRSKQEVPTVKTVKPPPNAAPFTEEWLAAIEAAGEEILTMKSGAVQNSPPDKAQHEPSPWSPVKKNQAIGPFDCTKHNIQHSTSPS